MTEDVMRAKTRELTAEQHSKIANIKAMGEAFVELLGTPPPNRELALARTKMEEAVMWATKGVTA